MVALQSTAIRGRSIYLTDTRIFNPRHLIYKTLDAYTGLAKLAVSPFTNTSAEDIDMPYYCVSHRASYNGDHELHDTTPNACKLDNMPDLEDQLDLGLHANCSDALIEAKKTFPQANGCEYCCSDCHTN